jgi:MFS family permease
VGSDTGVRQRLLSIFGGSVGNLIEWYDFYIYAAFSPYFAKAFFPSANPLVEQLNTAGVFALGFLIRPIGGWVMGLYADLRGRRAALSLSVLVIAALAVVGFYLRRHLVETEAFQAAASKRTDHQPMRELLRHPKELALVAGLTMGGTLAFYTYTVYMQKFLVNSVGLTRDQATLISVCSLFFYMLLQPVFGLLSDKIGRRPVLMGFGVLGTLCTVPLLTALTHPATRPSTPWSRPSCSQPTSGPWAWGCPMR